MKRLAYFIFCSFTIIYAQEDLFELYDVKDKTNVPVQGIFKATRIVNAQSVELPRDKTLEFIIFHRFGSMSEGLYDLYGLDAAMIRFDLNYGFNEKFSLGFGRSSLNKTYDLFTKIKLATQMSQSLLYPATIVLFTKMEIATFDKELLFSDRITYDLQLLIARKISSKFSLQIIPTLIHRNLIEPREVHNDLYSIGLGGRFKLTNRVTFNADTFFPIGARYNPDVRQSWGVGFDIDTGGHVFQLLVTNAQGSFESAYIENAMGVLKGRNIYFGFNITRAFNF